MKFAGFLSKGEGNGLGFFFDGLVALRGRIGSGFHGNSCSGFSGFGSGSGNRPSWGYGNGREGNFLDANPVSIVRTPVFAPGDTERKLLGKLPFYLILQKVSEKS